MIAWVAAVATKRLVIEFVAGHHDLRRIEDDDEVTTQDVRGVLGAMLAHENRGDLRGEATKDLALGIKEMPTGFDFTWFRVVGLAGHVGGPFG